MTAQLDRRPDTDTDTDTAPIDRARAAAYRLMADLVDRGVTPDNRAAAAASPLLAPIIAALPADALAASHYHGFGLDAPPFEGLLTDPEAQVGATATDRLRQTFAAASASPPAGDEPEHLATQLRLLADLCETGTPRAQAALLDRHLLTWLPPYEAALARGDDRFPAAIVRQIMLLAGQHRGALGEPPTPADDLPAAEPLDLAAADTGMREIAVALVRPATSGVLITRTDITRLGRDAEVPRGFGPRAQLLYNLLRSASDLGELPAIARGLAELVNQQMSTLAQRPADLEAPWLDRFIRPWQERARQTREALETIAAEAAAEEGDGATR